MVFVQVVIEESVLQFVQNIFNELRKLAFEETQVSCFESISIYSQPFHMCTFSVHILPSFI